MSHQSRTKRLLRTTAPASRRRGRVPRRAFTLVEALIASGLLLTLALIFWPFFSRATDAHVRMAEVMKTMDAATLQARLDEDIRTSIDVAEPADLGFGARLVFFDRQYRKVAYEIRVSSTPATPGLEIVRTCSDGSPPIILVSGLDRGIFFRMGPRLVGYQLDFQPRQRPGSAPDAPPVKISLTSKVYLANGIY